MNKKGWVTCLIFALSLLAGDVMAATGKSKGESFFPARNGSRSQKFIVGNNSRLVAKSSLSFTPVSAARHAHPVSRQAPIKSGPVRGLASEALKKYVIAIDAGHGGKDTGAIGPNGTLEKNVVYGIACKLTDLIRAEHDMRPVMVRRGDKFIGLRRRREIARAAHADLFISVHADAYADEGARGSSVFTLARHRAMFGPELADVSRHTLKASVRAARKVLGELRKKQHLHYRQVQKARFAVLKSPDVPSMLIETGFISNPEEELRLANRRHQERIARSIFYGVRSYLPPRLAEPPAVRTAGSGRPMVIAAKS